MSKNINTKEAEAKAEAVKGKVVTMPKGVKPNYIYYLPCGEDGQSEAVKYTIHAKDASEEVKAEAVKFFIDKGVDVMKWFTTTKDEEATKEAQAKDANAKAVMSEVAYYSVKLSDYEANAKPKATRQSIAEAKAEAVKAQIDAIEAMSAEGLTIEAMLAKLKAEALGVKAEA